MLTLTRFFALVLCGTATLLSGCYSPTSVACEGVPGGYCKEGYVCTAKQPFLCILADDLCGNGTKDDGEQCDDGNRRGGDGCSEDCGSSESCGNAVRDNAPERGLTEECDPAVEDSSVGPSQEPKLASRDSARCDRDCTATLCGDGYANEVSEQCDPHEDNEKAIPDPDDWRKASADSALCNRNCTRASCGDGVENDALEIRDLGLKVTHVGEECDPDTGASSDRQRATADSATCDRDCTVARCGDGVVNAAAGEECDPRVDNPDVTPGRGLKEASGYSATCGSDCTWAKCGNGQKNELQEVLDLGSHKPQQGEFCDPKQFDPTITATDNPQEASGDTLKCDRDCTEAVCGDLYVSAFEQCDDGNDLPNDGCSKDCKLEKCGNGVPDPGELCDDGNTVSGDKCSYDCKSNETCGDGVVTVGEGCDDENEDNNDVCVIVNASTCFVHRCGDGFPYEKVPVNAGPNDLNPEQCDGGDYNIRNDDGESATCNADCTHAMCGDGTVNKLFPLKVQGSAGNQDDLKLGEKCDPNTGNTKADPQLADADSASCDRDCTVARCGDGYVNANYIVPGGSGPEVCDGGGETATCDLNCTPAFCGDGDLNSKLALSVLGTKPNSADASPGEKCDPKTGPSKINANRSEAYADSLECDKDCTVARCGDGYWNQAPGSHELCDEGGDSPTCDADCTVPKCGDGAVNLKFVIAPSTGGTLVGEQCDPGVLLGKDVTTNGNPQLASAPSAACDVDCTAPRCGDSLLNTLAGEFCDSGGNQATCDSDCTKAFCGDGFQNNQFPIISIGLGSPFIGEFCDPNTGPGANDQVAAGDSTDCDLDCTGVRCGDRHTNLKAGEECDNDAATFPPGKPPVPPKSGDGCSSSCQKEECGNGRVDKVDAKNDEGCDPGTGTTSDRFLASADGPLCDSDCTAVSCGDNHHNTAAEECEDGDKDDNDGCSAACKIEACGNGRTDASAGEKCDPNTGTTSNFRTANADGPGCDSDCTFVTCGDNHPNTAAEECDHGNKDDNDGCSAACKIEACGNGRVDASAGEKCDPSSGTTPNFRKAQAASATCSDTCTIL